METGNGRVTFKDRETTSSTHTGDLMKQVAMSKLKGAHQEKKLKKKLKGALYKKSKQLTCMT